MFTSFILFFFFHSFLPLFPITFLFINKQKNTSYSHFINKKTQNNSYIQNNFVFIFYLFITWMNCNFSFYFLLLLCFNILIKSKIK